MGINVEIMLRTQIHDENGLNAFEGLLAASKPV